MVIAAVGWFFIVHFGWWTQMPVGAPYPSVKVCEQVREFYEREHGRMKAETPDWRRPSVSRCLPQGGTAE